MSPSVTVREVEEIPTDSRVCHYDELEEPIKERFPTLAARGTSVTLDRSTASELGSFDLVKYTSYYAIEFQ